MKKRTLRPNSFVSHAWLNKNAGSKRPQKLPLLLQGIALAVLAPACSGDSIDASRFDKNVCTGGVYKPLQRISPAQGIDSVQLFQHFGGPEPTLIDSFGVPCDKAADKAACQAAIMALHDPMKGWNSGGFEPTLNYMITTSGDMVQGLYTFPEAKAVLGTIDTPEEAAFVVSWEQGMYIECGNNVHALGDGSFEVLAKSGSTCGEGTSLNLNVVVVKPDGSSSVTETELLEEGDPNCVVGRMTEGVSAAPSSGENLGAFLARMATLEAAAVPAFERLAKELEAYGAPGRLVEAARRSARDEVRHARSVGELARVFGGEPGALKAEALPVRDLEEIAVENAAEGCVRETFGALVATVQAKTARDARVAKLMRGIARDEGRHAQLSWEVMRWMETRLGEEGKVRVEQAMLEAVERLRRELQMPVCEDAVELAGFPDRCQAMELFGRMVQEVWTA